MIGLVTARRAESLDPDLRPLAAELRRLLGDDQVAIVCWDDHSVDWSAFAAVVIRSTWDYADRLPAFVRWVELVDAVSVLINSAELVRWSTDKRYLAELAAEGIPITPTTFVAPGESVPAVDELHVVKPSVGAGSNGARRCEPHEVTEHVELLHAQGHTAMVQPYLDLLDAHGETALCYVVRPDGSALELSHAFGKAAILRSTDVEQEGDLFAKEEISSRHATPGAIALGERVLATDAVRRRGDLVFARIDIAPQRGTSGDGVLVVMEVELIEPSFYFETERASVQTFAAGLTGWLERRELASSRAVEG